MEGLYQNHQDLHVAAYYVYGKTTSDTKAYVDAACTVQFTTSQLVEVFKKGALIVIGTDMYKPVSLKVASDVATINYIKPNGTTATSADIAGLVAKKDA